MPELLSVLNFSVSPVPYLTPELISDTAQAFRPPVRDFQLFVVEGDCSVNLPSAAIMLCTAGGFALEGEHGSSSLTRGQSVFITPDEGTLTIRGTGQLFVATTQ